MEGKHERKKVDKEEEKPIESGNDIKTLLSWVGPSRPFRKKTKQYYLSALLIVLFFEVIFFLFSQYELMLVALAFLFLTFVLAYTPPQNYHYRVSTEGISFEKHFYLWQELYDFYFKKVDRVNVLFVRTHDFIPGEIKIPLGDISEEHVRKVLIQFLPYREVVQSTFMEQSADWLSRNFPLEDAK